MFAQGLIQKDVSGFPLFGMGRSVFLLLKSDTDISKLIHVSKRSLGPLFIKEYFTKELFILYDLLKLYLQKSFSFRKRCNMLLNIPAWVLTSLIHTTEGKLALSVTIYFVFTGCCFVVSEHTDTQLIKLEQKVILSIKLALDPGPAKTIFTRLGVI